MEENRMEVCEEDTEFPNVPESLTLNHNNSSNVTSDEDNIHGFTESNNISHEIKLTNSVKVSQSIEKSEQNIDNRNRIPRRQKSSPKKMVLSKDEIATTDENLLVLNQSDKQHLEAVFRIPDLIKVDENGRRIDPFCWFCHKKEPNLTCSTCPRSFHDRCSPYKPFEDSPWTCIECVSIVKAEKLDTNKISPDDLQEFLQFALEHMMAVKGIEPFIEHIDVREFPDYLHCIANPMYLNKLKDNILNKKYSSTVAFNSDVKWIHHNSKIFNGHQTKLTNIASTILRTCREQMFEIEMCPECYKNAIILPYNWFTAVCKSPHILLWAKLKGFPYWPAKAMTVNEHQQLVNVRFFGAHDRAGVPVKDCFLYSVQNPNGIKKKAGFQIALDELNIHIKNIEETFGSFQPAPFKTPLNLKLQQIHLLIPNLKPDLPESSSDKSPPFTEVAIDVNSCQMQPKVVLSASMVAKNKLNQKLDSPEHTIKRRQSLEVCDVPNKMIKTHDSDMTKHTSKQSKIMKDYLEAIKESHRDDRNVTKKKSFLMNESENMDVALDCNKQMFLLLDETSTTINNDSTQQIEGDKNEKVSSEPNIKENDTSTSVEINDTAELFSPTDYSKEKPVNVDDLENAAIFKDSHEERSNLENIKIVLTESLAKKYKKDGLSNKKTGKKKAKTLAKEELYKEKLLKSLKLSPTLKAKNNDIISPMNTSIRKYKSPLERRSEGAQLQNCGNKSIKILTLKDAVQNGENQCDQSIELPIIDYSDSSEKHLISDSILSNIDLIEKSEFEDKPDEENENENSESSLSLRLRDKCIRKSLNKLSTLFRTTIIDTLKEISNEHKKITSKNESMLELELQQVTSKHSLELIELKHNYDLRISEIKTSFEEYSIKTLSLMQLKAEDEKVLAVNEAKSKQWCANCRNQSSLYCCWNTTYCDEKCQNMDWKIHKNTCQRIKNSCLPSSSPT